MDISKLSQKYLQDQTDTTKELENMFWCSRANPLRVYLEEILGTSGGWEDQI